jgi:hypothetical protein
LRKSRSGADRWVKWALQSNTQSQGRAAAT